VLHPPPPLYLQLLQFRRIQIVLFFDKARAVGPTRRSSSAGASIRVAATRRAIDWNFMQRIFPLLKL
jgi:hypothetical protein